jgi:hypothetical protein
MINNQIFYHAITRKIIVAFGSLFSEIKIKRDKDHQDGPLSQTVAVPISYAPKEKWLVRIEQDPNLSNNTYISLPRLSFEITGMNYDPSRRVNRGSYITCPSADGVSRLFAPVPYNIDITLYAITKTQEDGLQIVEQIVPYFAPEFTMSVKAVPEMNVIVDVPIILNSVSVQDDYDGDFQTRRFVTYTMNFTLKAMMFGPVSDTGVIIKKVLIDVDDSDDVNKRYKSLITIGDEEDGSYTEQWTQY